MSVPGFCPAQTADSKVSLLRTTQPLSPSPSFPPHFDSGFRPIVTLSVSFFPPLGVSSGLSLGWPHPFVSLHLPLPTSASLAAGVAGPMVPWGPLGVARTPSSNTPNLGREFQRPRKTGDFCFILTSIHKLSWGNNCFFQLLGRQKHQPAPQAARWLGSARRWVRGGVPAPPLPSSVLRQQYSRPAYQGPSPPVTSRLHSGWGRQKRESWVNCKSHSCPSQFSLVWGLKGAR